PASSEAAPATSSWVGRSQLLSGPRAPTARPSAPTASQDGGPHRRFSVSASARKTNGSASTCGCRSPTTKLKNGNSLIVVSRRGASAGEPGSGPRLTTRLARHHQVGSRDLTGKNVGSWAGGGMSVTAKYTRA